VPLHVMDIRAAAADYVARMVSAVPGVKALILDDETARIVGVVCSQTDLFRRDVFLTERLGTKHSSPVSHLAAVVFIRPTAENVRALRTELHSPTFGSYHIFFSNLTRPTYLEEIADADETHAVSQVHEHFADFYALDSHLFSFQVLPCLDAVLGGTGAAMTNPSFERTVDGIVASLLALKRRPVVRYQGSSPLCKNLADRVAVKMDQEAALFGFRRQSSPPILLILDRCEDPVTPLLNQWTYEAMVHELIGAETNRVSLAKAPNVPEDLRDVVLDAAADDFYRRNRYENFGELGINLKKLVDAFHKQSRTNSNLTSIEDMMRFVGSYPEFRRTMANVSKHVAISSELSRLVEKHDLLQVSQLEQEMACREAEGEHRKNVMELLANRKVTPSDKLRLVMLYSLRYEESAGIRKSLSAMIDGLYAAGVGSDGVHLISGLRDYAGARRRSGDVFSNRSFFALASNTVRRGIGGVENVYTQHEPLLAYTLDDLLRGRLKMSAFPAAHGADSQMGDSLLGDAMDHVPVNANGASGKATAPSLFLRPPREVVVIIAGGATFEESKCVSGINGGPNAFKPPEGSTTASAAAVAKQIGTRIVLGGSTITNSSSFAVEIARHAAAMSAAKSRMSDRVF
jgi:vacuolar protein sorting-associated protein 45